MGFELSLNQANQTILSISQFRDAGHFSKEKYQHILANAYFTPETFQAQVRQGMLLNQQRFAFMGTSFVLPSEVDNFFKLYMQRRDYKFMKIDKSFFYSKVSISDHELMTFYQKNKNLFQTPEKIKIDYLILTPELFKSKIVISDADLLRYYNENKKSFKQPLRFKVESVLLHDISNITPAEQKALNRIPSLQLFAHARNAAAYKPLEWLDLNQSSGLNKQLLNLRRKGETVLIKQKNAYKLIRLLENRHSSYYSFVDMKDKIHIMLSNELAQEQYLENVEQLSDITYQAPDSLVPAAEQLELQIQHSDWFTKNTIPPLLTKNRHLAALLFSHDILDLKNNSDVVPLNMKDQDGVIVFRVKAHAPVSKQSFAVVKQQLYHLLQDEKAQKLATQWTTHYIDQLNTGHAEKQSQFTWKIMQNVSRDAQNDVSGMTRFVFSIAQLQHYYLMKLALGNMYIVDVEHIRMGDYLHVDKEQQASIQKQLEASYGIMDYDLYVNSLVQHAKIERS